MFSVVFWCAEEDRVESVLQNTQQNGGDALSNFGHVFFTGFQFFRPLLGNTPKCVIFLRLDSQHAHSPRNRPVLWKIWITAVETRDSRKVPTSSVKTQTHRTLRMFLVIMTCIRALYWSDTTAPPRTRTPLLLWPQPAGAFTRQPQASEASSRSNESTPKNTKRKKMPRPAVRYLMRARLGLGYQPGGGGAPLAGAVVAGCTGPALQFCSFGRLELGVFHASRVARVFGIVRACACRRLCLHGPFRFISVQIQRTDSSGVYILRCGRCAHTRPLRPVRRARDT